ncbi:hypothetical protein ACFO5K_17115 [Nocardia halotolerans]|uniref:Uncharacterized protein n=1 Tax=Nocardia halotolerans TaxID=1755878 RepID=A0ABV8VKM8_9NOCA
MKRSLAVATLAGALMLAPLTPANAATEQVAPVAACVEFPIGAPDGCDFIQNILQLLSVGSSSLSSSPTAP